MCVCACACVCVCVCVFECKPIKYFVFCCFEENAQSSLQAVFKMETRATNMH